MRLREEGRRAEETERNRDIERGGRETDKEIKRQR